MDTKTKTADQASKAQPSMQQNKNETKRGMETKKQKTLWEQNQTTI